MSDPSRDTIAHVNAILDNATDEEKALVRGREAFIRAILTKIYFDNKAFHEPYRAVAAAYIEGFREGRKSDDETDARRSD